LSKETDPDGQTLTWTGRVWSRLSAVECIGVLHLALRYNFAEMSAETVVDNANYIDRMALLPWLSLGEPLQRDVARALDQLRQRMHVL
jgi:hypothetical protein